MRARRRAFGDVAKLLGIAISLCQPLAEIIGNFWVGSLQIDDLIALDNADARAALPFKSNDFHELILRRK